MKLFAVKIERGRSHLQWPRLLLNLESLGAKPLDYTGHWGHAAVKHPMNPTIVHGLLTEKIRKKSSINVEEITKDSLLNEHSMFEEIYVTYFSRYDSFPNIG